MTHQEGAETVKAQEVDDGKVGATGELLSLLDVRFGVALLPVHGSHHDLLPLLSSSTSEICQESKVRYFVAAHTCFYEDKRVVILTGITSGQPEGMSESCCCG